MQTSFPLLIVRPSILNPVINFSTHVWPVKRNTLGYTFALRIPFHLLQCRCNTCTNMINNELILHIITWPYWFIDLDFTCFSPLPRSIGAKSLTCPSLLQPVHQAKPCLDLLHLSHMIPCHISYAMSTFITCVSFVTSPSHFTSMAKVAHTWCICGLITYVSHIKHN